MIFAGTALKLEKAGSTFSSFNPCPSLLSAATATCEYLFTDAPSPQNRCTRVQSRVSLTTPFQLSEAKQKKIIYANVTGTRLTPAIHRRHSSRFFSEGSRGGKGGGGLYLIFCKTGLICRCGKTRNIVNQPVLHHCCKTRCTFLVANFTVPWSRLVTARGLSKWRFERHPFALLIRSDEGLDI